MNRALPILLLLLPAPLAAQLPRWFDASASGAMARATHTGAANRVLSGTAFGIEARLGGRLGVEAAYVQGALSPDTGNASRRDLVDARAMLSARLTSWLTLKGGAHIIGFVATSGTERWMRWEVRGRVDRPLASDAVLAHVEGWFAASTDANIGTAAGARGAEAGLTLRFARSPVSARLAYSIDHATLAGDAGAVTLEQLSVSLRLSR